jgi:two-component system cell cycle sensor histidine kinase/response regulator CckA
VTLSDGSRPQGAEQPETILLVEDEPAVRKLFAVALVRAGYRDLLLTDMRMPYMGGAELAQHLRARRQGLKLICISGYPGENEVKYDFLAKPFSRDELLKKVREVLDRPV